MNTIRCLNCRTDFEEPNGYLGHECRPDDATAVEWEMDPEYAELVSSLGVAIVELGDSLDELDEIADEIFGPDEDPVELGVREYLVIGVVGLAVLGLALYEGLKIAAGSLADRVTR